MAAWLGSPNQVIRQQPQHQYVASSSGHSTDEDVIFAPLSFQPHFDSSAGTSLDEKHQYRDEKAASILDGPIVVAISDRDDTDHFGGWARRLHFFTPVALTLLLALGVLYVYLRIRYTLDNQRADAGKINVPAWSFLAAEMSLTVSSFLNALFPVLFSWVSRGRKQLRVVGDVNLPTVDLLICTCGEELEEILDTVRASLDVDWPTDRFRVIVCDDGRSDELQSALEGLRQRNGHRNLVYQRRPKVKVHHAKAGNLRAACDRTLTLTEGWTGPGDYLASLDADMIPTRSLLRALVAPLLADEKTAFACAPQCECQMFGRL